jgi:Flp pilus assembly protein TadG
MWPEQKQQSRRAIMSITGFGECLRQQIRSLWHAENGNVAVLFGLTLIPLVAITGAAIDYSRASIVRTAMQAALDATALAVSKQAATLTSEQLNEKASAYFKAAFDRPEAKNVQITATYSVGSAHSVTLSATTQVDTRIMGVVGIDTIDLGTTTSTRWGDKRLRVALALDTTGSMEDSNKIGALKTATKNLLDQFKAAATNNGDIYVSIIPFSKNVNLGSSNHNASWIDWTDWEAEPDKLNPDKGGSKPSNWYSIQAGSDCPFSNSNHGFRCVSEAQGSSNVSDIPSSGNFSGLICPGQDSGNEIARKIGIIYNGCYNTWTKCVGSDCACTTTDTSKCACTGSGSSKVCETKSSYKEHTWRPGRSKLTYAPADASYTPALKLNASGEPYATPAHRTWTGCVTDRGPSSNPTSNDNYDRQVDAPGSSAASKYPAEQNYYCSPEVMNQNYNWSAMKTYVDGLFPRGATNQPIGLVWAWQSLVGGGPFTVPPKSPNDKYDDVIILMSDGLNTLDRWYGNGSSTNTSVDKRMIDTDGSGTCKNAKDAGIKIYAIHFNTGGDPMSTLLQNCASEDESGKKLFWMVTNNNEFIELFKQLGIELTKLRLAL